MIVAGFSTGVKRKVVGLKVNEMLIFRKKAPGSLFDFKHVAIGVPFFYLFENQFFANDFEKRKSTNLDSAVRIWTIAPAYFISNVFQKNRNFTSRRAI